MSIKNLKIKTKIWSMVVISIVSLSVTGILAVLYMNTINQASTEISANWMPSVILAEELDTLTSNYRIDEFKHVLSTDSADMAEIEASLDEINAQIQDKFSEYQPLLTDEQDEELYNAALAGWENYITLSDKMIELSRDDKVDEARALLDGESETVFTEVSNIFDQVVEYNKAGCDKASAFGDRAFVSAITVTVIFIFVVLVGSVLLSILISNGIIKPIKEIDAVAKKIANEELDTIITYESKDELGALAKNFNLTVARLKTYIQYIDEIADVLKQVAEGNLKFTLQYDYTGEFAKVKNALDDISDSLNDTLTNINQSSDAVATNADQMSGAAQGLAEGATEQASIVEELVATIQDVSEKIRMNAQEADNANGLVGDTRKNVERSNDQMQEMIVAINEINEKSKQIVNIVGSIEDIASQTNLLSLNASIEAARAGEAGKGFAVVADQIGKLASESAEAAQNTVALIDGSIKAVEKGTAIANETAESLNAVVEKVETAASKMRIIAEASQSQAEAMSQVESGVETISNVIQNNSAAAEETSATSEELNSQAQLLKGMVSKFILK